MQRRGECLRQPQQAEIVDVHLELRVLDAGARGDAEGAMTIGGVDEDIDLAADLAGERTHRAAVGQVERHRLHLRQLAQTPRSPAIFFHGSASPVQTRSAPASTSARTTAWPITDLPSRDQNFAPARIAGQFAQSGIVGQIGPSLFRHGDQRRLAGAVERRFDAHAARRGADARVQISDHVRRRHRAGPCRRATAGARGRTVPGRCAASVSVRSSPRRPATRHTQPMRQAGTAELRAADIAPRRSREQTCSSNRPRAAAAVRPSATRLRVPGGNVGRRVRRIGFLRFGRCGGIGHCLLPS